MNGQNPQSTARIMGHPIHPMLVPFPIAFLVGAFLSDIAFAATRDEFWSTASFFLLAGGLVFAALAAVAGLTDFLGDRRVRSLGTARRHMIGNVTAVLLSLANFWLRTGDHQAPILSTGIILSALVTLILVYTGWLGGELVFRHRVGIADASDL